MTPHFTRARLLFEQDRHELAAEEFRRHLLEEPNDAPAHAHLAISLAQLEKYQPAMEHAETAVGLAPDTSFPYLALSVVFQKRKRWKEARAAADEAIAIDGGTPAAFSLRGTIALVLKDWRDALSDADAGLALDPEDEDCLNLRAMALTNLGRGLEANESLSAALQQDPENALTHANQGWTLLQRGDRTAAMHHFREALRLDPNNEWARLGIVESLKASHFVYRLFLKYVFWMSRLKGRVQWGLVIGAYFLIQFIQGLSQRHPDWEPWLSPVVWVYIGFVLLSWLAIPLFNLLLRTNRFGRLALSREQTRGANLLGAGIVLFTALCTAAIFAGGPRLTESALRSGLFLLPLAGVYLVPAGRPRWIMTGLAVVLALCGIVSVSPGLTVERNGDLYGAPLATQSGTIYFYGIMGSCILANVLQSWEKKH